MKPDRTDQPGLSDRLMVVCIAALTPLSAQQDRAVPSAAEATPTAQSAPEATTWRWFGTSSAFTGIRKYEVSECSSCQASGQALKQPSVYTPIKVSECSSCQASGQALKQPSVYTPIKIDGAVEDVIGVEELAEDLKIQESLRSIVSDNVSKKQEKAKGRAQQIGTVFKPGDRVWRQNTRSQQRKDKASASPAVRCVCHGGGETGVGDFFAEESERDTCTASTSNLRRKEEEDLPRCLINTEGAVASDAATGEAGCSPRTTSVPYIRCEGRFAGELGPETLGLAPVLDHTAAAGGSAIVTAAAGGAGASAGGGAAVATSSPVVDGSVENNISVEEMTEDILKLDEAFQSAINNNQAKTPQKKAKKTAPPFQVGIKVWRLNVRSQQRKGGKLDPNYLGPFTIVAIDGKRGAKKSATQDNRLHTYPAVVSPACHPAIITPARHPAVITPACHPAVISPACHPAVIRCAQKDLLWPLHSHCHYRLDAPPLHPQTPQCEGRIGGEKNICSSFQNWAPQSVLSGHIQYWTTKRTGKRGEVINAYLSLLIKKYNDNKADRACAVDTFEMTRIWDGLKPKVKIVPQLYKLIVGIVNAGDKKTVYLDPLGERKSSINHCKDVTRSFMRHRGLNVSRWACETRSHPLQHDATSCGAYALKFAECILGGLPLEFDNSTSGVNSIREHIAVSILENTDDLSNLCHLCGEQDGDTHWLRLLRSTTELWLLHTELRLGLRSTNLYLYNTNSRLCIFRYCLNGLPQTERLMEAFPVQLTDGRDLSLPLGGAVDNLDTKGDTKGGCHPWLNGVPKEKEEQFFKDE
ncbi:unnamed protein product, partial [Menidia menidia]